MLILFNDDRKAFCLLYMTFIHFVLIVYQDPVLFSGTLRFNLDPFNYYTDEAIWHALELANLKSFIKDANNNNDANFGLDMNISEGGSNIRLVSAFGSFC